MQKPVDSCPVISDGPRPKGERTLSTEQMDLPSLFKQNYVSIWRLLRRLGIPDVQVDDAAQEVFWVAARRLDDIEPGREHSFLYGVALRIASNLIRRQSPLRSAALDDFPHLADPQLSPEESCERWQLRQLLDSILLRMPEELRFVFVLCELEELEVKQVAALIDIPVGTASSRLRRAREEFSAIAKRARIALQAGKGHG